MNNHPEDQPVLESEHGQAFDRINDQLIGLQDRAYALGRKRGMAAAERALAALKLCIAALERGEHCTKEQFDTALDAGHAACKEAGSPA